LLCQAFLAVSVRILKRHVTVSLLELAQLFVRLDLRWRGAAVP
jgi:hypothetical protein